MKNVSETEFDIILSSLDNADYVTFEGMEICECGQEVIVYAPFIRLIHPCVCGILLDIWLKEKDVENSN